MDSQYSRNHIGTLAVHLPIQHTGGALVVGTSNSRIDFETYAASKDSLTAHMPFVAWHSCVVHQVEPVTSGYRLVLIYQLFRDSQVKPVKALSHPDATQPDEMTLTDLLWKLVETDFEPLQPKGLVVLLKYRYSIANINGFIDENELKAEETEKHEKNEKKERRPPLLTGTNRYTTETLIANNTTRHNTTRYNTTTQHNAIERNTTKHNNNTTQHNTKTATTQHNTTKHNLQQNTTKHNTTRHDTTQNAIERNATQRNTTQRDTTQ